MDLAVVLPERTATGAQAAAAAEDAGEGAAPERPGPRAPVGPANTAVRTATGGAPAGAGTAPDPPASFRLTPPLPPLPPVAVRRPVGTEPALAASGRAPGRRAAQAPRAKAPLGRLRAVVAGQQVQVILSGQIVAARVMAGAAKVAAAGPVPAVRVPLVEAIRGRAALTTVACQAALRPVPGALGPEEKVEAKGVIPDQ